MCACKAPAGSRAFPSRASWDWPRRTTWTYQRACFERAAASGHTPALHGVLPPSEHLPRGALLVQAIEGRPARLPHDLPALATALAALHALPLPEAAARAPLLNAADPLQALAAGDRRAGRPPGRGRACPLR